MKQPPNENRASGDQQTEDLVAAIEPALLAAPRLLGLQLEMWFDPGLHHGLSIGGAVSLPV